MGEEKEVVSKSLIYREKIGVCLCEMELFDVKYLFLH